MPDLASRLLNAVHLDDDLDLLAQAVGLELPHRSSCDRLPRGFVRLAPRAKSALFILTLEA